MTLPSNGQTTIKPNNMNLNISEEKKTTKKSKKSKDVFLIMALGRARHTEHSG